MNCKLSGAGLRSAHYSELEQRKPCAIHWFEVVSENYIDSYGRPRHILMQLRKDFPIALHGVSMNLASAEGVNLQYLKQLKSLISEVEPFLVSDHLCWTGGSASNIHDLLPFPYTRESLQLVVKHIDQVQSFLNREILIENVSSYISFKDSEQSEQEFISEVARQTGCGVLLDINNVYVSAMNHAFDPKKYIDTIDTKYIKQVHLAGYSMHEGFLFDTHSHPVYPEVWDLFSYFISRSNQIPFMVEWDEDIPSLERLEQEMEKAQFIWSEHHAKDEDSKSGSTANIN